MKQYFKLIIFFTLALLVFQSCNTKSKVDADHKKQLRSSENIDCTLDINRGLEECQGHVEPMFTCPEDGTYKGVNPFDGEDVAFAEEVINISIPENGIISAKAIKDGENTILIFGKGNSLNLKREDETETIDLGSEILSVETAKFNDTQYLLIGTNQGLKIKDLAADNITTLDSLKGISKVIVAASIDLSKQRAANLPPGVSTSLNLPHSGNEAISSSSTNLFVYLLNNRGEVWRINTLQLINGGCVERLYVPADNLVANDLSVAGQYLAILTETKLSALPGIGEEAANFWNDYKDEQLAGDPKVYDLTIDKFFWLANHIVHPDASSQSALFIDLLASTEFTEVSGDPAISYHITDLKLIGDKVVASAYKYQAADFANLSELNTFTLLSDIWEKARKGIVLEDQDAINISNNNHATLLAADLNKPNEIAEILLPAPEGIAANTPESIFTKLGFDYNNVYIRGENRFFAEVSIADPEVKSSALIEQGSNLTPLEVTVDRANKKLITTFIGNLEELNLETKEAAITE